jgi:VanZ family protein
MKPRTMTFDPKYGFLTVVWMGGIYWLSSRPDLSTTESDEAVQIASNLAHVPLFAGLAFCWFKALSGKQAVSWWPCGLTFLGAGAWGVLDEWHQSFVPGRVASVGDVLLDLAGVGGMLVFLHLRARAVRGIHAASPS